MKSNHVCESCHIGITDPICENCYLKQLELWLQHYRVNDKVIRKILRKSKSKIQSESLNGFRCILCGRDSVTICSYCSFSKIEGILQECGLSKKLIDTFLGLFNYELYNARIYSDNGSFKQVIKGGKNEK